MASTGADARAMKRIDCRPPRGYLFPCAGPDAEDARGPGRAGADEFEAHPPFTDDRDRAVREDLRGAQRGGRHSVSAVDLQSAIMYAAWQVLETVVTATKTLEDKALAMAEEERVKTLFGTLRWNGPQNLCGGLGPLQGEAAPAGRWIVVTRQWAAPGALSSTRAKVPSATLLGQSLSGIFIGALYGLLGLGLSLSWGMLRQVNLAHFALAFLGGYRDVPARGTPRSFRLAGHHRAALLSRRDGAALVPVRYALTC